MWTIEMKKLVTRYGSSNAKDSLYDNHRDKEVESNQLSLRSRSEGDLGTIAVDDFIDRALKEIKEKKY